MATEKEEKHKPGKIPLSYLPGVCDYLFFAGRRLNHQPTADARKGSQIGAGQGREGLDNAHAYTCRVGGESTAVFPSPLMLPPYYR